jgi:septal ring factor EnvC (AmiA/AmiB activator)
MGTQDDIAEIKQDIREIKSDLSEHMSRTAAGEARLEVMEEFLKTALGNQQENFRLMLDANERSMIQYSRQLKVALGVFAGLAGLVTALVAFLQQ